MKNSFSNKNLHFIVVKFFLTKYISIKLNIQKNVYSILKNVKILKSKKNEKIKLNQ